MKWVLIAGGVGIVGYVLYRKYYPYLFALKNVGTVAGDVKQFTGSAASAARDVSNITHSISEIFSGWGTSGDSRIPSDSTKQTSGVGGDSTSGSWGGFFSNYSSWGAGEGP